jgi:transposase InsO family protein
MDQRMMFIAACLRGKSAMSQVCAQHGISRKTGHKWLARYEAGGVAGLADVSHARHTQHLKIDGSTATRIIALRAARPTWGPRKLLARLRLDEPSVAWPSASTVGDMLRREGLSEPRARRRSAAPGGKPVLVEPTAPNVSWAADFKGWFRTGDGVRCEPLTVTDGYSRYILACQAMPQVTFAQVQPVLMDLFKARGLPQALRTDNGNPFGRRDGLGGLSHLSIWLLTLDVWPDFILPARPDMNGRHERMHRVLHEDVARPPAANVAAQQARFDLWREDYNTYRPHEALGQRCPATLYVPSTRLYPASIRAWEYPADHQIRKVIGDGYVRWRGQTIYLSGALVGEMVALAQRDDGDWAVRFRSFDLAVVGEADGALRQTRLSRTAPSVPG